MKKWILLMGLIPAMAGFAVSAWAFDDDDDEEPMTEAEVIQALQQHDLPHLVEELREGKREDPDEYEEMLEEFSHHIRHYRHVKKISPETAEAIVKAEKLEHRTWELADAIGGASGSRKDELIEELRSLLGKVFDYRMKEGEFELKQLEQEMAEIRDGLDKRRANKDRIIQHRLQSILNEMDETMSWW